MDGTNVSCLEIFLVILYMTESTDVLCVGQGAEQLVASAFHITDEEEGGLEKHDGIVFLPGVVSRKKQLAPQIIMALQQ